MKNIDIKKFSIDELITQIELSKNYYKKLKLDNSVKVHENPMVIRLFRKNIARLITELNKKISWKKLEIIENKDKDKEQL
ncbi:50S ribosomal protein L29 [Blattabacterium cuenoti]|uniref:50S ribosomal protein L29 n=1 Tax=Blattabacterium cuenoti TaxID=1653831 RepID=UPI00163BE745|nr:50S ribosomal protein L29 [Blattabacterium cuenoti]